MHFIADALDFIECLANKNEVQNTLGQKFFIQNAAAVNGAIATSCLNLKIFNCTACWT